MTNPSPSAVIANQMKNGLARDGKSAASGRFPATEEIDSELIRHTWTDNLTRESIKQGQGSFGSAQHLFSASREYNWSSGNATQQIGDAQGWIAVNLGSPRRITEFEINFNGHEGRHRAGSITFAFSNTQSDWTSLVEGPDSRGTPFPLLEAETGWEVFYKGSTVGNSGFNIMAENENIITCDMFLHRAPVVGQYVIMVFDWQQYAIGEDNRAAKGDNAYAVHISDWFLRGTADFMQSVDLCTGDTINLNAPGAPATWSTADTSRVSVTADGTVTAVAPGRVVVTATNGTTRHDVVILISPLRTGIISREFLARYPGNTRTAAVMPRDTMHPTLNRVYTPSDTLNKEFGRNIPDIAGDAVEGANNAALAQFPGDPLDPATGAKRHLQSVWDAELQRYVMQVNLFGNKYVDGVLVSCEEGCYRHGPQDRQRVELKANNHYLYGRKNELSATRYLMKMPAGINEEVHGFFHIFQYKAILGTPNEVAVTTPDGLGGDIFLAQSRNSEAGMPILTLTVTPTHLQFRHSPTGAGGSALTTLTEAPISEVIDRWLDINIQILNAVSGWVTFEMRCVETGKLLMQFKGEDRTLNMWRRTEIDFPTPDGNKLMSTAFEGRPDQHNRFKWGIYRSANKALLGDAINDVSLYLADITIFRPGKEGLCGYPPHHLDSTIARPVNLASGAIAIDVTEGTDGNHEFQRYHNVPSRVTDDLICTFDSGDNSFTPFGWVSPAANTPEKPFAAGSGSLVLDLGSPLSFSMVKTFTKTKMLESATVSIPNISGPLSEAQMKDPDTWAAVGRCHNIQNDLALTIDLEQTHTQQYVRVDFVGGNHLLCVSQIEVFNLPQKPASVIAEYIGDGNVQVSWEPVPEVMSYTILDGENVLQSDIAANTTSVVVDGLQPDAVHRIGVSTIGMCQYSFKTMSSLPRYNSISQS